MQGKLVCSCNNVGRGNLEKKIREAAATWRLCPRLLARGRAAAAAALR
ncbi:hypothetical protein ACQ86N_13640 [Puia sp. P3]